VHQLALETILEHPAVSRDREEISTFLLGKDISDETISRIELAWYEVVVNFLEHGTITDEETVTTDITVDSQEITVSIRENFIPYDILKHPLPEPETHTKKGKDSGLGIYMVRNLTDGLEYTSEEGINCTKMIFSRSNRDETQ
jgi:anti-sigma regulatory factor (Ser/Thr protein kinase)